MSEKSHSTIIPTLRYRNAPRMLDWLSRAFGFTQHACYGDGDIIHHAELVFGDGMIMLGSARDDELGKLQAPPSQGAAVHQSPYVIVVDADAHHARAVAAGAEIVRPLMDQEESGGRGYSCRDPEGQLWHFGTYNPWKR